MLTDFLTGKTILVTGSSGYLGSTLATFLAGLDVNLRLLVRSPQVWKPRPGRANIAHTVGSITEPADWRRALFGIDYVFHLAGLEYGRANNDPTADFEANFMAVVHMLRECEKTHLSPSIIFSSSANVAGQQSSMPVPESTPALPPSIWSLHKLMAEQYLAYYSRNGPLRAVSLRLGNIYGPCSNPEAFRNSMLNRVILEALSSNALTLYPNRNCLRDYLHIDDAVSALVAAAGYISNTVDKGFFYVASDVGRSFDEVWQKIGSSINSNCGTEVTLNFEEARMEPIDLRSFVADSSGFRAAAGWAPRVDFENGLDENVRYAANMQERRVWPK